MANKEKANNENSNNEATQALQTFENTNTGLNVRSNQIDEVPMFVPNNLEQLAVLEEIQNTLQQVESLGVQTTLSKDLAAAGTVFNIIGAFTSETKHLDKAKAAAGEKQTVVVFKLMDIETGEEHTVVKGGNTVNLKYAKAFSLMNAMSRPLTLEGYMFKEEPKYNNFGNNAIILVKAPKVIKQVN